MIDDVYDLKCACGATQYTLSRVNEGIDTLEEMGEEEYINKNTFHTAYRLTQVIEICANNAQSNRFCCFINKAF